MTLLALAAAVVALDLAQPVQAQGDEQSGRIVARRLDDGRTEFGWQPVGGERVLPRARYFPADAGVGRWLNSSPVEVDGVEIGRINARLREDGRIEFAFTPTDGERILPPSRYFPAGARVGRWLRSTEIVVGAAHDPFVAVDAGAWHTCGLRASGEITCWGDERSYTKQNGEGPAGRFIAISAGGGHTCGLRENGEITCWGWTVRGAIPAGPFTAVSAGDYPFGRGDSDPWQTACGLRDTGTIECWGENDYGQADPPGGRFTVVSTQWLYGCGLRESGEIKCWGYAYVSTSGNGEGPGGRFIAVSAGGYQVCGLHETGAIECWGTSAGTDAPGGRFTAVSGGGRHTCGLRETGAIECWGSNSDGQLDAPAGLFSAVSAGELHTCGLRNSGAIECWGRSRERWSNYGQADAPDP